MSCHPVGPGTVIIKSLASQLDANVEVEAVNPGTKVSIVHVARAANSLPPMKEAV